MTREAERLEEDEVLRNLPIELTDHGTLPAELQHLFMAIDRLNGRRVIVLVTNGLGPRWVIANPGARLVSDG